MILAGAILVASWNGHVVSVGQLVNELTPLLGKKVAVPSSLAEERIFVEARNSAPTVILRLVAKSLHGKLVDTPNGYEIKRDASMIANLEEARKNERIKWISERIASNQSFRASHTDPVDPVGRLSTEANEEMEQRTRTARPGQIVYNPHGIQELIPGEALLEKLIERIGLEEFADLPSGEGACYDDGPTPLSYALPNDRDLKEYYLEAMKPYAGVTLTPEEDLALRSSGIDDPTAALNPILVVDKLRLTVRATPGGIDFRLEGFSSDGKRTLVAEFSAMPEAHSQPARQPINLNPDSVEVYRFAMGNPSVKLPSCVVQPVANDPLDSYVRDALEAEASLVAPGPFVAIVPDDWWTIARSAIQGEKLNLDRFDLGVDELSPHETIVDPEGIVWRPLDPDYTEGSRADRRVLQRYTTTFLKSGMVDIRDACLLFKQASSIPSPLAESWLTEIQESTGDLPPMHTNASSGFYKLLGGIDDDAWNSLLTGQVLSVGSLNIQFDLQHLFIQDTIQAEGPKLSDLTSHPTELLVHGVDPRMATKFRIGEVPMIENLEPDQSSKFGWLSMPSFISLHCPQGHSPEVWDGDTPRLSLSKDDFEKNFDGKLFRLGTRSQLTLLIDLDGVHTAEPTIEGAIVPTGKAVPYASLPEELKSEIFSMVSAEAIQRNSGIRKLFLGQ